MRNNWGLYINMKDRQSGNYYNKNSTKNIIEKKLVADFNRSLESILISLKQTHSVLEIGCGEGSVLQIIKKLFPDCHYTGVDIDKSLLELVKKQGADEVFLNETDPLHLPYEDNSFDLVLMIEVLEHLKCPHQALQEAKRMTKNPVIISVPREPLWRILNMARLKYWKTMGNTPGHLNHWNTNSFKKLVREEFLIKKILKPLPWIMIYAKKNSNKTTA